MAPAKSLPNISISLRESGATIVRGCPGVPRSMPRIETVIQIRSVYGTPVKLRSVGVEIRTFQKLSVPTTLGSNDTSRDYKIFEDPSIYRPPVGEFHKDVLGADIPILIPLPKDVIASGQFDNWNASTIHNMYVKVSCGDSYDKETTYIETFAVPIKLYDTLPLYRQFNEPITETSASLDQQVLVDISLPVSSLGPQDELVLYLKIMTNASFNRTKNNIKLSKITLQIKEVLECHEGGLPPRKENKIFTTSESFEDTNNTVNTSGQSKQLRVTFPLENDYLHMFANKNVKYSPNNNNMATEANTISSPSSIKAKNVGNIPDGVPFTHTQGYTTLGKLFSIRYEVVIKIKLLHAKDMEIRLPITVSTYDRISSHYLLQWIMKECEHARTRFGRNLINRVVQTSNYDQICKELSRFALPTSIIANNATNRSRYGADEIAGTEPPLYID